MKKDSLKFVEELRNRRSDSINKAQDFSLEKKDVFSESCLGLCVE